MDLPEYYCTSYNRCTQKLKPQTVNNPKNMLFLFHRNQVFKLKGMGAVR